MSLDDAHRLRSFDDATTNERRARVYVSSGELNLPRADVELMNALVQAQPPVRVHVIGASGAGKTSLIIKVIGDLTRRTLGVRHEVLVLRIGDAPESLASQDAVIKLVLDTIAAQDYRFSSVDPQIFADAAADQRTQTPTQIDHRATLNAGVVSYSGGLREAYTTNSFGTNPARLRHDLEDVLREVARAGYRPVLVLDDTEKFVSPGANGTLDVDSVTNLYHNGVRVLGEFAVDLVVAMHPRFEEVDHVREVVQRLNMPRIEVPELPADADPPALQVILRRRLERDGIETPLDEVIAPAAVEELQLLYHERDRDLRSVLKVAHAAAAIAVSRASARIEARDVRTAVVESKR